MKKALPVLFTLFILHGRVTHAQQHVTTKDYSAYPYWIAMMDDSTVNYYVAQKAFEDYWQNRRKPEDEDELFSEAGEEHEAVQQNVPYSFEYRQFLEWERKNAPFVKDDGSILYPYQQLRLIQQSRH